VRKAKFQLTLIPKLPLWCNTSFPTLSLQQSTNSINPSTIHSQFTYTNPSSLTTRQLKPTPNHPSCLSKTAPSTPSPSSIRRYVKAVSCPPNCQFHHHDHRASIVWISQSANIASLQLSKYPALANFEKQTSVPKVYVVLGLGALYFFLVFFNIAANFLVNTIGFAIPAYYSLDALFTTKTTDDTQVSFSIPYVLHF
jgi:hypothetical protein